MNNLFKKYSDLLFPLLIFSPGLRGLGTIYYLLLAIAIFFCFPLLLRTYKNILKSKISLLLIIFYFITLLGLIPSFNEYYTNHIILSIIRIALFIIFIFYANGCKEDDSNSNKVVKCYLLITFIASAFIFLQYLTGPIDIFSEQFSTRAGLPRYSTLSGSTNVFSISVAFSILISTFCFPKIDFIRTNLQLFLYQSFILIAACANLSRSGLLFSIIAFLFSRSYLYFAKMNPNFASDFYKIPLNYHFIKLKIPFLNLSFFSLIIVILLSQGKLLFRFSKTIIYFVTGNKNLISSYDNATFENTDIKGDLLKRLNWFSIEYFDSLIYHPQNILFGGGSKYFGGTIGLPRPYSHNMFIDIFQAQGIFGIMFLLYILTILFLNSTNSPINKIKPSLDLRSISISTVFLMLCTHNSGIFFHPLTIYPLIFIQDFVSKKDFIKLKN